MATLISEMKPLFHLGVLVRNENCVEMKTERECVCCRESFRILETMATELACITGEYCCHGDF